MYGDCTNSNQIIVLLSDRYILFCDRHNLIDAGHFDSQIKKKIYPGLPLRIQMKLLVINVVYSKTWQFKSEGEIVHIIIENLKKSCSKHWKLTIRIETLVRILYLPVQILIPQQLTWENWEKACDEHLSLQKDQKITLLMRIWTFCIMEIVKKTKKQNIFWNMITTKKYINHTIMRKIQNYWQGLNPSFRICKQTL